ncbi:unnamed protein product [Orchesella dallaii]|uniref:AAA+ ATPase domain-containing protein n=1 Tax=Orchesella dallaii TaxID=48710 RepID=A0ABP1Q7R1_9HEXA
MATKTSPKKSLLDYFKSSNNGTPKAEPDESASNNGRSRPTRACANKARQAWNGSQDVSISSDEDEYEQSSRKRTRTGSRKKQSTLGSNGSLVTPKDNNSKKKVKLDPETEAFLRSGVPDVINTLKSRTKSLDNNGMKASVEEKSNTVISDKRKTLDAATLAFLHSGVPDVVDKARQTVEKKRDQDELFLNMGFFPKTTHISANYDVTKPSSDEDDQNGNSEFYKFKPRDDTKNEDSDVISLREQLPHFKYLSKEEKSLPIGLCCDENPITISSQDSALFSSQDGGDSSQNDSSPWIDRLKVTSVKNLVVDKNALETFTNWLKRWKMDIKDDGGTSRKHERKKKRGNSSDSDFVTSDEDEDGLTKKSVLLTGPSGCGKTAAVYVLAKHYGFEVVEVNFSTRRPGKEVLQRVEEAVLSHRLKSSQNCLLLFKDIDLLHPEEDEGFCSAVAQLITTAVRPIVMTSCLPVYCLIDSKLDRKDPLRISFSLPKPKDIVDKILKPILSSKHSSTRQIFSDSTQIGRWLDCIVRHCGCDIRQSINQLQLILTTSNNPFSGDKTCLSHQDVHLYSTPFLPHLVDLNFPRQCSQNSNDSQNSKEIEEEDVNLTRSARRKRCIEQLEQLGEGLELFSDLDWISRLPRSLPKRNVNTYGDFEEATWNWNYSGMRSCFFTRLSLGVEQSKNGGMKNVNGMLRELVLESDTEVDKWMQIDGVNDEIGQYCDRAVGANGIDWESCGTVRTIVKSNMLDSIGGKQKRNGRMTSYFNRLDRRLVEQISDTFDFRTTLDTAKEAF